MGEKQAAKASGIGPGSVIADPQASGVPLLLSLSREGRDVREREQLDITRTHGFTRLR